MPRKLVLARSAWEGSSANLRSSEVGSVKTVSTSPGMLSNSILVTENAPTSQPARVNGTHGAGAVLPNSLTISGWPSAEVAVQYRNELWKPTLPFGRKK